jgi:hypothetical protein
VCFGVRIHSGATSYRSTAHWIQSSSTVINSIHVFVILSGWFKNKNQAFENNHGGLQGESEELHRSYMSILFSQFFFEFLFLFYFHQIAPAMGPSMVQRAKDLLLSPPLHKALMTCINPPAGGSYGSNGGAAINPASDRPSSTDVALYVDLARELLANAIQM